MLMYYIISILQFFATNLRKNLYVYYTQKQNYVLLYIGSKQKQSVGCIAFGQKTNPFMQRITMSQQNEGHRERLRERMLKEGLGSFQDHEVLELLLFQYIPRKDTNKIAHDLLDQFGSIYNILNAPPQQLMTVDGVSKMTACNLSMLKEVLQRYTRGQASRKKITSVQSMIDYAKLLISNCYVEQLVIIYVDNTTTYLHHEIFCSNNTQSVTIDVKKVVATAVRIGATGVVIAHCHPNGELAPSEADIKFTRNLFFALGSLDVLILDHVIFNGGSDYFSMYDSGIMRQIQSDYCKLILQ